ncbi:hypothetical protein, partial [Burkholderia cenocepacia]|uniref:hypothetical protein n=1 Tax=Burkholderia cenocepacia TaxID=95486 RepID=UPI001BA3A982
IVFGTLHFGGSPVGELVLETRFSRIPREPPPSTFNYARDIAARWLAEEEIVDVFRGGRAAFNEFRVRRCFIEDAQDVCAVAGGFADKWARCEHRVLERKGKFDSKLARSAVVRCTVAANVRFRCASRTEPHRWTQEPNAGLGQNGGRAIVE